MRLLLEQLTGKRIRLNIQEIRQPEQDAFLVAKNIAQQIERRISHRRAMKQAISRTMESGAQGIKITCSGRLTGSEYSRKETLHQGRVPLHTLRADIDYAIVEAHTTLGRTGVKVWIYKGDILPESKRVRPEVPPQVAIAEVEAREEDMGAAEGREEEMATVEGREEEIATVEGREEEVATVEGREGEMGAVEGREEEMATAEEREKEISE